MNKIDKYLRRFAYKIETSKTKESRYYTIVNFKRYLTVRFMKFGKIQKFENMLKNLKLI